MMQYRGLLVLGVLLAGAPGTTANVIVDWDEIAVGTV
jgi:hypothetical protein